MMWTCSQKWRGRVAGQITVRRTTFEELSHEHPPPEWAMKSLVLAKRSDDEFDDRI
jgi:hypothetical protein